MTWVIRNGQLVEKSYEPVAARSSLPSPFIIRDGMLEPLQHQANGRWYDSKRAMEKANKEAGCVCVGNDEPKKLKPDPLPPVKDDVIQAFEMVKQGYKPGVSTEKDAPTESGWF